MIFTHYGCQAGGVLYCALVSAVLSCVMLAMIACK